jgi:C4-dicarboxylate-specific signal transduction histidine kinase
MARVWQSRFWSSAVLCGGGSLAIALLSYLCLFAGLDDAAAGFALMILLAFFSLAGRFADTAFLAVLATTFLDYFFITPIYSFRVETREGAIALVAFLTTSLIITFLAARMRRMASEELRQTRAALARFARVATLGELTASIAHEVNQPLAGVVSSGNACLRWLAADPPNLEKASQSAHRIIRDANRASDVVQRVRALVKNAPPAKAWVDINQAFTEVALLMHGEIEQSRVFLTTELADNIAPVWVDRIQLQQVFLNLIGNALEALRMVENRPRTLIVRTENATPHDVLASVRDNGAGLDPAKLHEIFNAFYSTKNEGMGMGLAICRSIIEDHGGRLWAQPGEPSGAIFQFSLPAGQGEPA